MKNSKLTLAYWLVWITGYGSFVLAGVLLILGVHYSFQPEAYDGMTISGNMISINITEGGAESGATINDHPAWLIWLAFLRGTAILVVVGVMSRFGVKIIKAVQKGRIFIKDNSRRFRSIGAGFLVLMVITFFEFSVGPGNTSFTAQMKFGYLLAALSSFILAEIFEEGARLEEESKLTV